MFDSLKKRLKQAVEKVTGIISKEEARPEKSMQAPDVTMPDSQVSVPRHEEDVPVRRGESKPAREPPVPIPEPPISTAAGSPAPVLGPAEEPTKEPVLPKEKKRAVKPAPRIQEPAGAVHAEPTEARIRKPAERKGILAGVLQRITETTLDAPAVDKLLDELKLALLENDVALEVAEAICSDVRNRLIGTRVGRGNVEATIKTALREALLHVMQQETIDIDALIASRDKPLVAVFFGFNGVGKTTTIAKFAHRFRQHRPVLAAGDTFRAASIEQLEEHGRRLGARVIKHTYGADSAAVIFDAVRHASASGSRLVLADTAGRSHANTNLMDELKKVCKVNKPDLKILVLDSLTGNDIYSQSKLFDAAVGVDAVILTKVDVYEKGGAALSAAYTLRKPVLFLGTGQEYGELKEFVAGEIASNLIT